MFTKLLMKFYTVDGALSAFNKAILRLRKAADLQRTEAARQDAKAAAATKAARDADLEATRALSAASKMEAIVS
jgi:hypothetical protein